MEKSWKTYWIRRHLSRDLAKVRESDGHMDFRKKVLKNGAHLHSVRKTVVSQSTGPLSTVQPDVRSSLGQVSLH